MANKATAQDVMLIIEKNFSAGKGFALLQEVGNSTGWKCNRHADAVALSLWPSRGIYLRGFEIKVSRQDWLHELKQPKKSAEVQKYCSFWDVVVPDESLVDRSELPPTWGLLVAEKKGARLRTIKEAPKLEPTPLDAGFVAAIIRRAAEAQQAVKTGEYQRGYEAGVAAAPKLSADEFEYERSNLKRQFDVLQAAVHKFEQASGVKIDRFDATETGEAYGEFIRLRKRWVSVEGEVNQMEAAAKELLGRLDSWRTVAQQIERPDVDKQGEQTEGDGI